VNKAVAAFAFGAAVAAPIAAQNPAQIAATCDPTANTRGDIAKAQFSMTRAISAAEKGNPTRDLQDVLRLTDTGNDNPLARNYLRGEAYILFLSQPNTPAVVPRSALGLTTNPTATVDLYLAADSAFTKVEQAAPECALIVTQWRQQKPWLASLNAAISALNAGQLDSAELYAKRALVLDRRAPYAYSVLGSVAQNRAVAGKAGDPATAANWIAANDYWKQAISAAGTDTIYNDVRTRTMYELASAASDRADMATGAAKRAAAREAIKPWQDYLAAANTDLLSADAIDHLGRMYMDAGDSASVPTLYAPMLANPSKYGELSLVHAGVVASRNGRHADAVKLFEAGMSQNPYSRDALNNLAATYIQNKQYPKAFPLIDRLIVMDPNNPDNPLLYAFAYEGLYKNTKDKKLQKIYTDSLIYFNNKSDSAVVKFGATEFSRRPSETILAGKIENRGKTAKTYTLAVDFLDKNGNVISTETTTVGPVPPRASQNFRIKSAKGGAYGYRYKPLV
jgi:tetratricopeptide (TPR) repeat protein